MWQVGAPTQCGDDVLPQRCAKGASSPPQGRCVACRMPSQSASHLFPWTKEPLLQMVAQTPSCLGWWWVVACWHVVRCCTADRYAFEARCIGRGYSAADGGQPDSQEGGAFFREERRIHVQVTAWQTPFVSQPHSSCVPASGHN
jgi:hypothetical protein